MSTMFLSTNHLATIARSLNTVAPVNSAAFCYIPALKNSTAAVIEQVNVWAKANCDSYNEAYEDMQRPVVLTPAAVAKAKPVAILPLIKLLDCLSYNTDPAKRSGDIEQVLAQLKNYAINKLPEYDAAPWSI